MIIVEKIKCHKCGYCDEPHMFPDIKTEKSEKKDFEKLSKKIKIILKEFGWNISILSDRLLLHGSLLICPECGNTNYFDMDPEGNFPQDQKKICRLTNDQKIIAI